MNPFDKEEYESLMETLEVLSDKKQVERLASALKHAQAGRGFILMRMFLKPFLTKKRREQACLFPTALLLCFISVAFFIAAPLPILAEAPPRASDDLSPVYEEMLGHYVAALKRSLHLRKVILLQVADVKENADFKKALDDLAKNQEKAFLLVISDAGLNRKDLEPLLDERGLILEALIREGELEYVQDASGRQILNLSGESNRSRIYERLVREGMNPVTAWPRAGGLIERFREDDAVRILVVRSSKV